MDKQGPFRIFIVEDDEWYREFLGHTLSLDPDFEIKKFGTGKEILKALDQQPDAVTIDYQLPDMDGISLLKKIKETNPDIECVIISEQENVETAVELLKAGAYDYISKSPDIKNKLHNIMQHVRSNRKLREKITRLEKEVSKKYDFENLKGNSEAIKKVYSLIEKAAQTNIVVIVTGETGTGKEVVAKAIHFNSKRKKEPFIAVNMAAIPKDLAESELFGHEKGAFTGALATRPGKFEQAAEGTIFLDEIGEMDLNLQSKLLRVLQEKELTRVGGNQLLKVNCRVIAATHRNLSEAVKKGTFREDLYYRLLGLQIHLPPLRERDSDIVLLAKHFIESFCRENDLPLKTLTQEAQQKLLRHTFPGNIRELKSVVELSSVMSNSNDITAEDIILNEADMLTDLLASEQTLEQYNKAIIKYFLRKYDDNVVLVGQKLDVGKSTIYRMLKDDPAFFEKS